MNPNRYVMEKRVQLRGRPSKLYRAKNLKALPTLSVGHFDNLKIDDGQKRVWLSRMGMDDGAPYGNQVTVERLIDGVWTITEQYKG